MMKNIDWKALLCVCFCIVIYRETAVWLMTQLNHPELGNLVGLFALLFSLIIWRRFGHIPLRLIDANNLIMKESAFAFLPICAGSLIMLMHMGAVIPLFLLVLCVSTLIPLWLYAKMAKRWL